MRRYYLAPIPIGIFDEVNAHGFIFIADAIHRLVLCFRSLVVFRCEGEVDFVVAQFIRSFAVAEPGEFQKERGFAVGKIDDQERAVFCLNAARFLEAERPVVELHALFEVENVQVLVCEFEVHDPFLS